MKKTQEKNKVQQKGKRGTSGGKKRGVYHVLKKRRPLGTKIRSSPRRLRGKHRTLANQRKKEETLQSQGAGAMRHRGRKKAKRGGPEKKNPICSRSNGRTTSKKGGGEPKHKRRKPIIIFRKGTHRRGTQKGNKRERKGKKKLMIAGAKAHLLKEKGGTGKKKKQVSLHMGLGGVYGGPIWGLDEGKEALITQN